MKIISTSYTNTSAFSDPRLWLDRISFYIGILEGLAKKYEVESIEQINYQGRMERNSVLYHFLDFRKPKLYFPVALHKFIKDRKPDIVFVNGFIFPLQIMQLRLALGEKVKIIVINRSEKPYKGVRRWLQRRADKCVDAYLFTSIEFGDRWIENGNICDQRKIYEVLHGSSVFKMSDKTEARQTKAISGSPVFLWVGRLDANKDPLTVVKAFIKYHQSQPSARLYMIFQTEDLLPGVKRLISENKIAEQAVQLIGRVSHNELGNWYNAADFFISGSHYEGGGIAVCEAMSCGCVPIVTNIISFRKMTGPGKCGLLYEPGNPGDLLKALLKISKMNIEEERKKVLFQFAEELSFDAISRKIEKVIASI